MSEFLIEIEGCLYDNPADVEAEFAKLRAEVEALRGLLSEALEDSECILLDYVACYSGGYKQQRIVDQRNLVERIKAALAAGRDGL